PTPRIGPPGVLRWASLEDLVVDGVQRPSDAVQQRRPLDVELLVHQLLRRRLVFDPRKAVVVAQVAQTDRIHLVGYPLAPLQAHLNREGEPGLNPGVQEPKDRMN